MKRLLIATVLSFVASAADAAPVVYTDKALFMADLASLGHTVISESFEDDTVWSASRNSITNPGSTDSVTSQGLVWTSNHPANNIATGDVGGSAPDGTYAIYSLPHGMTTDSGLYCDSAEDPNIPLECFQDDGSRVASATGDLLHAFGGHIDSNGGLPKITFLLDGVDVNANDTDNIDNWQREGDFVDNWAFVGVIDPDGFTSIELRELRGKDFQQVLIFSDDFTIGTSAPPEPTPTETPVSTSAPTVSPTPTETPVSTSTPTVSPTPIRTSTPTATPDIDHYVLYKAKATKREDLPDNGKFPKRNYNLLLGDVTLLNADADVPENYQVKKERSLAVPAMKNVEPGPGDPALHYLRYQVKEAKEGAGAFDVGANRYPSAVKHVKRTWNLTNQFGTITVLTKKVEAMLVPASKDLAVPPSPPADATHYLCYQAKVTKDVTDQTPDGGKGTGKFRKDIEAYFGDQFLDVDCAEDKDGNTSFAGTLVEGKCLVNLKQVKLLCNPASKSDVGGTRVTVAPPGSTSTPTTTESLLCYQAKLSSRILSQDAADLAGAVVGETLKQSRHSKRSPHTTPGNQFPAPLQVDTKKMEFVCVPTTVDGVVAAP